MGNAEGKGGQQGGGDLTAAGQARLSSHGMPPATIAMQRGGPAATGSASAVPESGDRGDAQHGTHGGGKRDDDTTTASADDIRAGASAPANSRPAEAEADAGRDDDAHSDAAATSESAARGQGLVASAPPGHAAHLHRPLGPHDSTGSISRLIAEAGLGDMNDSTRPAFGEAPALGESTGSMTRLIAEAGFESELLKSSPTATAAPAGTPPTSVLPDSESKQKPATDESAHRGSSVEAGGDGGGGANDDEDEEDDSGLMIRVTSEPWIEASKSSKELLDSVTPGGTRRSVHRDDSEGSGSGGFGGRRRRVRGRDGPGDAYGDGNGDGDDGKDGSEGKHGGMPHVRGSHGEDDIEADVAALLDGDSRNSVDAGPYAYGDADVGVGDATVARPGNYRAGFVRAAGSLTRDAGSPTRHFDGDGLNPVGGVQDESLSRPGSVMSKDDEAMMATILGNHNHQDYLDGAHSHSAHAHK